MPVQTMSFEWPKAMATLTDVLGEAVAKRWIAPLKLASVSEQDLILEAPNPYFRDWVLTHYRAHLQQLAGGRQLQVIASEEPPRQEPPKGLPAPDAGLPAQDRPGQAGERRAGRGRASVPRRRQCPRPS